MDRQRAVSSPRTNCTHARISALRPSARASSDSMRKARASIPFTRNSMDSNSARTSSGRLGHPEFDSDPLGSGPSEGTRASGWFAIQKAARQCIGTTNHGPRPSRGDRRRRAAHTAKRKPGALPGWTNLRLHGWRGFVRSDATARRSQPRALCETTPTLFLAPTSRFLTRQSQLCCDPARCNTDVSTCAGSWSPIHSQTARPHHELLTQRSALDSLESHRRPLRP